MCLKETVKGHQRKGKNSEQKWGGHFSEIEIFSGQKTQTPAKPLVFISCCRIYVAAENPFPRKIFLLKINGLKRGKIKRLLTWFPIVVIRFSLFSLGAKFLFCRRQGKVCCSKSVHLIIPFQRNAPNTYTRTHVGTHFKQKNPAFPLVKRKRKALFIFRRPSLSLSLSFSCSLPLSLRQK